MLMVIRYYHLQLYVFNRKRVKQALWILVNLYFMKKKNHLLLKSLRFTKKMFPSHAVRAIYVHRDSSVALVQYNITITFRPIVFVDVGRNMAYSI